jgi:acetyl-CoA C-acetyltransferase
MTSPEKTPVIVGEAQLLQRLDDLDDAAEPLEMMFTALERAAADAGAPKLLAAADSIHVVRGAWGYGDPGRAIGRRFGAESAETVSTPYGGNYAQACVIDAARAIQAGRQRVVLVVGAENGRSAGQAQRQSRALEETEAPGEPDRLIDENKPIFHEAELARGMNSASDVFAIVESAIRANAGESLAENVDRIAALWAGFSEIAQRNPNAWMRNVYTADEIGRAAPNNPMISYPYTRLMNANARVDMAAAVILCSLEAAREAGVPEDKFVFPLAATEAIDTIYLSRRASLHRSPAMQIAGRRALELAGKSIDEIDHVDLYSCFPSSVRVAANELGIADDRPLTVTGGLTFGGGPLNNSTLHAIARMVEVLREDRGSTGLVSANGGWLAKHAFAIYSTQPGSDHFRYENLQDEVDAVPLRDALVDWKGPVTIEAYTVAHRGGDPRIAHVACLTDEGHRTWGTIEEPGILEEMMHEEFCGRRGRLDGKGGLIIDSRGDTGAEST